jgi:ABC-2 type transport system permease protein
MTAASLVSGSERSTTPPVLAVAIRAFLDARTRTAVFAYVFAVYAFVQPFGYRHAYPSLEARTAFARAFAGNVGLRLIYGEPHDVASVAGYTAWRVGGTLAIAAAIYGLFAGVRVRRADEDTGRAELLLAGAVTRLGLQAAGAAAIAAGAATLWLAEFAGFAVGGLPAGGAAYLALATASVVPVCAGLGAVAGELASSRRVALELGGVAVGALFVLRVVADTGGTVGWLRWATPLGWAEELRPFAGPRPLVLLLPLSATLVLLAAAVRLGATRDVGTGVLRTRDDADPRLRLLRSPLLHALRSLRGALLAWAACVAGFGYILGVVSNSVSSADVSASMQRQIAKLGAGSIVTARGYLGFVFVFVVLAVSVFVCTQISAARQEEAGQQLETLLALPVGRGRWLAGRLLLAALSASAVALVAGVATWAGTVTTGTHVSLLRLVEAGANALPTAMLFLGIAAAAYAAVPRASTTISYAAVGVAFLWQLAGAVLQAPGWLQGATPFAHVGLVPARSFRDDAAAVMVALGAASAVAALRLFRRRDLIGP